MSSPDTVDSPVSGESWLRRDGPVAAMLFLATAGVVVWQNFRLAVLWDLSYVLENSYRISIGDVPYRDFPFPYAPFTFLTQAALIKLTGRVYFHHVIYCAVVGGLATVICWRILLNIFGEAAPSARLLAFLLGAPLTVLGIYCIFPHPFYDPDCTFAILVCVLLLQRLERKGFSPGRAFLTGASLVIPALVKQNVGLAFVGSAGIALLALMVVEARHRRPITGYVWTLAGTASGVLLELTLIHFAVGLANYVHWTMRFAASRRMPPLADMLGIYRNPLLPWWIATFLAGAVLSRFNREGRSALALLSVALMSAPFAWTWLYLFFDNDSSERAERLLALWPFLLIASLVFALWNLKQASGLAMMLPFVLIGTMQGAFLSQQLWGSTYALWPLLMLLLGATVATLASQIKRTGEHFPREIVLFTFVAAVSLFVSGGFYVVSHERLDYANVSEGEMVRSTLPALRGLSMRGSWIPDFEELVHFADREIPKDDGLLMIPGEDLFYYATGRHPQFPVLMFDHTVDPYSSEEILQISRARNIRWLVIKRDLQIGGETVEDKDHMLALLRQDFTQVESLNNYDVYRRESCANCESK